MMKKKVVRNNYQYILAHCIACTRLPSQKQTAKSSSMLQEMASLRNLWNANITKKKASCEEMEKKECIEMVENWHFQALGDSRS
jgi:hypothetical protein